MASGDMIAKLLLNTADFDSKLGKASNSVDKFSKKGASAGDNISAAFGKIAAVAAAVGTAFQTLKAGIESSQALTDAWGRTVESAHSAVDRFVYALANADFTPFASGLDNLIQKAKDMYDAYDQLANTTMSVRFATALDQSAFKEHMVTARNKDLSMEARLAALKEAEAIVVRVSGYADKMAQDTATALAAKLAALSGIDASHFDPEFLREAFVTDASPKSAEGRAEIEAAYKKYQEEMAEADKIFRTEIVGQTPEGAPIGRVVGSYEEERRAMQEIQARYAKVVAQYIALFEVSDEELQKMMDAYLGSIGPRNAASEMNAQVNEVRKSIRDEEAAKAKAAKAEEKAAKARAAKAEAEAADLASLQAEVYDKPMKYAMATKGAGISFDNSHYAAWHFVGKRGVKAYAAAEGFNADADMGVKPISIKGVEQSPVAESAKATAEGATSASEALGGLANVCSQLAGVAGESSSKILQFAANIAAMLSAIVATSSPLGVFSAIAGFATSSIPMFATGGIVTGPTLGVIGEAGTEAIIPLSKLDNYLDAGRREVRVTGTIRGSGKDLTMIINNYNKVRSVKNG